MKELNKEDKIKVLERALKYYKKEGYILKIGLCYSINKGLATIDIFINTYNSIVIYIPEFIPVTKSKYYTKEGYWWNKNNKKSRIEYLENLIKQIKES